MEKRPQSEKLQENGNQVKEPVLKEMEYIDAIGWNNAHLEYPAHILVVRSRTPCTTRCTKTPRGYKNRFHSPDTLPSPLNPTTPHTRQARARTRHTSAKVTTLTQTIPLQTRESYGKNPRLSQVVNRS